MGAKRPFLLIYRLMPSVTPTEKYLGEIMRRSSYKKGPRFGPGSFGYTDEDQQQTNQQVQQSDTVDVEEQVAQTISQDLIKNLDPVIDGDHQVAIAQEENVSVEQEANVTLIERKEEPAPIVKDNKRRR